MVVDYYHIELVCVWRLNETKKKKVQSRPRNFRVGRGTGNAVCFFLALLNLRYVCWKSPGEHVAVSSTEFPREIMVIHGSEVDQSSSTIFGHMTAGSVRFF